MNADRAELGSRRHHCGDDLVFLGISQFGAGEVPGAVPVLNLAEEQLRQIPN